MPITMLQSLIWKIHFAEITFSLFFDSPCFCRFIKISLIPITSYNVMFPHRRWFFIQSRALYLGEDILFGIITKTLLKLATPRTKYKCEIAPNLNYFPKTIATFDRREARGLFLKPWRVSPPPCGPSGAASTTSTKNGCEGGSVIQRKPEKKTERPKIFSQLKGCDSFTAIVLSFIPGLMVSWFKVSPRSLAVEEGVFILFWSGLCLRSVNTIFTPPRRGSRDVGAHKIQAEWYISTHTKFQWSAIPIATSVKVVVFRCVFLCRSPPACVAE